MDIINHYEVIDYNYFDKDKYTEKHIYAKCTIHYMNGKIHCDNDLPAIIYDNGAQQWFVDGKRHRDNDKPAMIDATGAQYWYSNGQCHRDNDQPAYIGICGVQQWWVNGEFIRDNRV